MKRLWPLLLVGFFLSGCESLNERLRDRFADVPPQSMHLDTDAKSAYYAAQTAFKRLDYTLTRSSLATLSVEAASRIDRSAVFADSRQLVAQVVISEASGGGCDLALRLAEQVESQGMGAPSERALRAHGFFATYFAVLQQVLTEQSATLGDRKN